MSEQPAPAKSTSRGIGGRIAAAAIVGVLLFGLLWYTIFSAVTAALIAAGGTGILVVGSSVSETFESLFELLANIHPWHHRRYWRFLRRYSFHF